MLSAEPAETLSLTHRWTIRAPGSPESPDNLVLRAARALADEAGVARPARLRLQKNLPVASGIGGGSADAAAALRLLCRLWDMAPDPATLARIAAGLGADVPVCLAGRARRMGGIGERLDAAPVLPDCGIVLVNPGVAVATAEVFRARRGDWSAPALLPAVMARRGGDGRRPGDGCATTWSRPPRSLQPVIGDVLAALADYAGLPAGAHERLRRYLLRPVR